MQHTGELKLPAELTRWDDAVELIRAWSAGGRQHVVLRGRCFDRPLTWGMFMADLVRHVVRMLELNEVCSAEDALAEIKAGFGAEWFEPTTPIEGRLLGEKEQPDRSGD